MELALLGVVGLALFLKSKNDADAAAAAKAAADAAAAQNKDPVSQALDLVTKGAPIIGLVSSTIAGIVAASGGGAAAVSTGAAGGAITGAAGAGGGGAAGATGGGVAGGAAASGEAAAAGGGFIAAAPVIGVIWVVAVIAATVTILGKIAGVLNEWAWWNDPGRIDSDDAAAGNILKIARADVHASEIQWAFFISWLDSKGVTWSTDYLEHFPGRDSDIRDVALLSLCALSPNVDPEVRHNYGPYSGTFINGLSVSIENFNAKGPARIILSDGKVIYPIPPGQFPPAGSKVVPAGGRWEGQMYSSPRTDYSAADVAFSMCKYLTYWWLWEENRVKLQFSNDDRINAGHGWTWDVAAWAQEWFQLSCTQGVHAAYYDYDPSSPTAYSYIANDKRKVEYSFNAPKTLPEIETLIRSKLGAALVNESLLSVRFEAGARAWRDLAFSGFYNSNDNKAFKGPPPKVNFVSNGDWFFSTGPDGKTPNLDQPITHALTGRKFKLSAGLYTVDIQWL